MSLSSLFLAFYPFFLNIFKKKKKEEEGNVLHPSSSAKGHLSISEDSFGGHNMRGAARIDWVEVKDAANHPPCNRQSHNSCYLAPNVTSAKVDKPWFKHATQI